MKKYRALWLMNHKTLRPFEVPMLIDMGFEVYCSKKYPYDEGNMSADIDYQYDKTLTIPPSVLDQLNEIDFYKQIPSEIMTLLNEYFDIAFFGFFPEQLKMLVEGFQGVLVMQAFGLATNVTYTNVIEQCLGISFLNKLELLGDRFFFGQSYENIAEIECRYFRNRAVYLPLGLKNAYVKDEWEGGDNKILFVCPRINTTPYFYNIYDNFKKNFKGFDYVIGGAQPIEVTNDDHVAGFLPKEQYDYNMKHLAVMFYHSQEKRHLHYHPLEAVQKGMPLVFMEGGILEQIAGSKLPGCCSTIREARSKITRIMKGDKKLINRIKESQPILLRPFSYEFCRKQWDREFVAVYESLNKCESCIPNRRRRKIGILLPEAYTGGVLDYTLRFVKCMMKGIREEKREIDLVFGYIDHQNFRLKDYFYELRNAGITIRPFNWKLVSEDYLNTVMQHRGWDKTYPPGEYCLPDDGITFFEDCDYLVLCVDRVPANFFTMRPYAVVVHDYIQRYSSEQYKNFYEKRVIDLQRNAEAVIVMTTPTLEDGIQYAGLKRDKLRLTPLMFDRIHIENAPEKSKKGKEYFLWSTNVGRHKNHLIALNALSEYYSKGGKLKCYVTGVDTKKFDLKEKYNPPTEDYISEIRSVIGKDPLLKKNLVFMGNMDKQSYYYTLKNAKFFMHPGFIDNGNMTAIDAAFLGVPTLTSEYPAMRYYEDTMHLGMKFFNPFDARDLAESLFYMEENYLAHAEMLPPVDELERYTVEFTYKQLYATVKDIFKL